MTSSYDELRQRHIADLSALLPQHLQRLRWTPDEIRAERESRLRTLVRTAQKCSPWHRERLAGIDAETLTDADLERLPVMTKADVMAHWDGIVTDHRLNLALVEDHLARLDKDAYLLDHYHAVTTSGSSGRRGVFLYDWDGWATAMALGLRGPLAWTLAHPDPRPLVHASVTAERATAITSAGWQTFSNPNHRTVRIPVTNPLPDIVARLNETQPTVLGSYPSMLNLLAGEARGGRLKIQPHRVNSVGEPLLPEVRQSVETTFGAPVFNAYGSTEGIMSGGCGQSDGAHLTDDMTYLEPVDAEGHAVSPGTRSDKVYFTNLYNLALPLIRYEITDQVTIRQEPCPCGSAYRRVGDVEGRLDEVFEYPGGTAIHPYVLRSQLVRRPAILEYQVRQTERGVDVAVRLVGDVDLERLRDDIADALARLGLENPAVTVVATDELEHGATGKLKRFIPLARRSPVAQA